MKGYLSFRVKISLLFSLLTFLIVGIMAAVLFEHFKSSAEESIYSTINMAIIIKNSEVQTQMNRVQTAISLVNDNEMVYLSSGSNQPELASLICEFETLPDNSNLYEMSQALEANEEAIEMHFFSCFGKDIDYAYKIYVESEYPIAKYLNKVGSISGNEDGIYSNIYVKDEEWYQNVTEMDEDVCWFTLPENPMRLYMVKPLKYQYVENMKLFEEYFGVLTLWFDISWFTGYMDMSTVTDNACIWLNDNRNNLIYASNEDVADQFFEYGMLIDGQSVPCKINNQEYLVQKKSLNEELNMITAVPANDISSVAWGVAKIIFLVAVAMLSITVLVSMVLSIYVVKPIKVLAEHMQQGSIEPIKYHYKRNDEVTILYSSFNYLIHRLKKLMQDVVDVSERKKRAEFHALQAQINPHFIYNTLNSISSLELLDGRKESAGVLSSLAQIIRYNIKDPDGMVSLIDDVKIVKYYVNIQSFCYKNVVEFESTVEPTVEKVLIPKVLIQPLVENAFIHGTRILEHDARIRLKADSKDSCLCIQVWDNGTDADVEWINQYIRGEYDAKRKTDSLGIRNVYERIRMIYGEKGGLIYSQDENGCTIAAIYIPLDCSEEEETDGEEQSNSIITSSR